MRTHFKKKIKRWLILFFNLQRPKNVVSCQFDAFPSSAPAHAWLASALLTRRHKQSPCSSRAKRRSVRAGGKKELYYKRMKEKEKRNACCARRGDGSDNVIGASRKREKETLADLTATPVIQSSVTTAANQISVARRREPTEKRVE